MKKKKTTATAKDPTGQVPKPVSPKDGRRSHLKTKTPKGMPVRNYST